MTKKGLGIAVLLSLGIAVLSGCGAKSSSQAVERAMPAAEAAAEEKAGETAAEEKAGEAAEAAAEEKTGETESKMTLASRLAGVYSCEQDGEYHTLELFEFGGNLLGQGGIAEKPEGNDPAEPYSFWALEVVPADAEALLGTQGDSFEAGVLQYSIMSNMDRYWGAPEKTTVRLTDKGISFAGLEYVREDREGTAFTDVSPLFSGLEAGTVPEKLPGLWRQKNGGDAPVFLEFSEEKDAAGAGALRIYRKAPGKEAVFGCGKFFVDKDGRLFAGSSFTDNMAPEGTMNVEMTLEGDDALKLVPEEYNSLFESALSLEGEIEFERIAPEEVPLTVLAEPDDLEALQGTKTVKTDSGERRTVSQFLATEDIENNGGYFVRVGSLIFFRDYSGVPAGLTGIFGDFLHDVDLGKGSRFCCFDKASGKTTALWEEEGHGPLYYVNGMFYFSGSTVRPDGTESEDVYRCWPDGSGREAFTEDDYAVVAAVSETGHRVLVNSYKYGDNSRQQGTLTDGTIYGTVLEMDQDLIHFFSGFDGDDLILGIHDDKKKENRILRVDGTTGEETVLGILPESEADGWGYPSIDQMLRKDDELWFGAAWYGGTAVVLQDYMVLKADARKENSLTLVTDQCPEGFGGDGDGKAPKFFFNYADELLFTKQDPEGEVILSEGSSGDLVCCDSPLSALVLQKDFVKKNWYDADDGETVQVLQKGEIVGGDVYLIMADAVRTPEEDIGWRLGFTSAKIYQQRIAVADVPSSDYSVVQLP